MILNRIHSAEFVRAVLRAREAKMFGIVLRPALPGRYVTLNPKLLE